MATFSVTRTTSLFNDVDGDGLFDPGDIVTVRIRFTNNGPDTATNVSVTDTMNGLTLDPSTIKVTPIAFDDTLSTIMGNTPVIISKASLLGNDQDPDGLESALTITGTSNVTGGTLADNGDGTFTFTPTTGFNGNATFQYTITDAQGLQSVTTGLVTIPVSNFAWYVDSAYGGANGASDGSYLRPFTSFQPLNDDGTASGPGGADGIRGDDDVDGANNIIFVYNRGTAYTGGISLENGQTLYGDGHEFTINNIAIGQAGQTAGPTINHSTYGVTAAIGNTIRGLDLNGTTTTAVGLQNAGAIGNLFVDKMAIGGSGQSVNLDSSGALNVTLTSLSSNGSSGGNGGVIDLTGMQGVFTVTGTTSITGSHLQNGIDITGNSGLTATFTGATTVNVGANIGVTLGANSTTNVSFTGGLAVTTTTTQGFHATAGTTLVVSGGTSSVNTTTGQILSLDGAVIGAGGVTFNTLAASGSTAAGPAIRLNNVDGGAFSGGNVTIAGTAQAGQDGLFIGGGSASNFTFGTVTIDNTLGDGIELNGANGTVTIASVDIDGVGEAGIEINGATAAVSINGGNIGSTNDPAGDSVEIIGGTGAVTVAANIFKSSSGFAVDVQSHSGNPITFSGNINSSAASQGLNIVNNTSGQISFTGATKTLATTTAGNNAINMTGNIGSTTVSFTNGNLDIDVTSGTGINATGSTGQSTLVISGTNNDVLSTTGRAINIDGVTANVTLERVDASGGSTTAVFLKNTGASGQFVVTGVSSTASSGGTISNISGADVGGGAATSGTGYYFENVSNVSLSNINLSGTFTNFGIRGENVNNFTLRDSTLNGTYGSLEDAVNHESAIRFGGLLSGVRSTGLTGTALFEGNNISGGFMDAITIFTNSGTLNLTIRDSANDQAVFGHNQRNDIILVESGGNSNLTMNVTGVQFTGSRTEFIQTVAADSTIQNITIANNVMNNGHANIISGNNGIFIGAAGAGSNYNVTYAITGNTLTGAKGSAIHAYAAGQAGTMRGTILNNTIGTPNGTFDDSGSSLGGDGILVRAEKLDLAGTVTHAVRIEGNTIRDIDNGLGAIRLVSNGNATANSNILEATIKNNTVAESGPQIFAALYTMVGGNGGSDAARMGLDISNNNFSLSGSAQAGNAIYLDNLNNVARYYLPGYAGSQNGESGAYGPAGTASADLHTFLTGTKANTFVNGGLPSRPGSIIDAPGVIGTLGTAFTQPVPAMAAAPEPKGWEELMAEELALQPQPDEGDVTFNDGLPPEPVGLELDGSGGSTGGDPVDAPPTAADDGILSQAELDLIVEAAIQRWIDAGATDAQVAAMRATSVSVIDMVGVYLGSSEAGAIRIDSDGAGYGWFIDATPGDDSEYELSGSLLKAAAGSPAAGKIDLLTVVMHELGHQIGLDDDYQTSESDELMYGYVNAGERRLPEADEVAAAGGPAQTGAYALTPVAIGDVPNGKTVDVYYNATIDSQTNKLISDLSNTATIEFTHDHDGNAGTAPITSTATASETTVLDTLTLGDRVWLDADKDGVFDSGEGVQGVALTLFADTGSVAGELDATDTQLATTTTLVGGVYSFTGIAPGEYIVRVDASNFAAAAALNGKITSAGSADPDDNVDGDDNGVAAIGGSVASKAITLDYNTEPTNGVGNDTNNTLDFSFFTPNQAPAFGALNGDSGTFTENGSAVKIDAGGNATVTDGDSANFDGGSLTIAWNSSTGDSIIFGSGTGIDGSNNVSVGATQIGVLTPGAGSFSIALNSNANASNIQTLIRALEFSSAGDNPTAGTRTFNITLVDGDGTDGGAGSDTGTASATINVVAVNDAPSGADNGDSVMDNAVLTFTASDFSTGMTDPENHGFAGVKITTLPSTGTIKLSGTAISAGATITKAQLDANALTYEPAAGSGGTAPTFTFQVQDDGGTANSGVDLDPTPNTFTITVQQSNVAPVINNLQGDDVGFLEGSTPQYADAGGNASVTDADSADFDGGTLTVEITSNEVASEDVLAPGTDADFTIDGSAIKFQGTTVATFTGGSNGDPLVITFNSQATPARVSTILTLVNYDNSNELNPSTAVRTLTWTLTDGDGGSTQRTSTITVVGANDSPDGTSAAITATEDAFRVLSAADFGFTDPDSGDSMSAVTITAVNGAGLLYYDADGSAGAGAPVAVSSFPQTYTVAELADGRVSYRAPANANGNALATIDFQVVDSAGAGNSTDPVGNTLTVNVSAANDTPVLTGGATVNASEQTAVAILSAVTVSDVDLDAKNGGSGDYAGAVFSVNRNPASNAEDVFTIVPSAGFTVVGNDLQAGGLTFATISANANGIIAISFTSSQTMATSALVDEVIQSIRYTNTSDNPPASVTLAAGFTDGSPGGGQGGGATGLDIELITVNIAGTNDAPVVDLNGAAAGSGATLAFTEGNGTTAIAPAATVSDVDSANFEGGTLVVDLTTVGTGDYLSILAGNGITFNPGTQTVAYNGTDIATYAITNLAATYTFTFLAAADAAAVQALVRQIGFTNQNDNIVAGDRNVAYTLSDGDGGTASTVNATVSVTAVDDAAVAQPDNVATPENAVLNGDLFANNGNGPDSDVDGPALSIEEVNGQSANVGTQITLASGAKLTVNADGTFSYDPNGKFNHLVSSAKAAATGAVNDGQTESFTYKLTNGNTVTVVVNVTGVDGAGDQLWGNAGDNTITGTAQNDVFRLQQGGNDSASGLGGDDGFFFGAALTSADNVDGGADRDYVTLQGQYNALTLGAGFVNVELITLLAGNDTRYGDTANNFYDYSITTNNANVAAGQLLTVDGAQLRAGEDFTFNGSAETDGSFRVSGGLGVDNLTGGSQSDYFFFSEARFGAADIVNGGAGSAMDQLSLRGDYSIGFGAGQLVGIDIVTLLSGRDIPANTDYDYQLTMHNGNVAAGARMIIDGGQLKSTETLTFNGSAETDGFFWAFGGKGNDSLTGGQGNDLLVGGAGADYLKGGAGADVYRFRSASESTSTGFDQIDGFVFGTDTIDLPGTHDTYEVKNTGTLNLATFDSDLAAAMAGTLDASEAVLFTASSGTMAGRLFLIVDQNGIDGYQAGDDFVIELLNTSVPVGSIPDFLV